MSDAEPIVGKQIIAMIGRGTMIGPAIIDEVSFGFDGTGWGAEIVATPIAFSRSLKLEHSPPKTRREKRARRAFLELLYGGPITLPRKRQLIHRGRKP